MVRAWRKSTSLARLCSRPFSVAAAGFAMGIAAKSVHPAGISERLPSGSTTSSNATPRRCTAPQRLQNAALEGMPLAEDFNRTWEVAEMGSVWWCSLGAFPIPN